MNTEHTPTGYNSTPATLGEVGANIEATRSEGILIGWAVPLYYGTPAPHDRRAITVRHHHTGAWSAEVTLPRGLGVLATNPMKCLEADLLVALEAKLNYHTSTWEVTDTDNTPVARTTHRWLDYCVTS